MTQRPPPVHVGRMNKHITSFVLGTLAVVAGMYVYETFVAKDAATEA